MILENKTKKIVLTAVLLAVVLSFSLPAFAHKVNFSAYVEGDNIIAEGSFGDGSPTKNAEITIHNQEGELLAEGKTDDDGICKIPIPKKTDLDLEIDAGMGHHAHYSLAESELPEINDEQNFEAEQDAAEKSDNNNLSEERLRTIIAEELEKQLNPIKKSITKADQDTGPGLTEIIGGIGYIFGLMGVALYFKRGKK